MIGASKLGGDIIGDVYCYKYGFHKDYPSLRTRIDERKQTDRGMKEQNNFGVNQNDTYSGTEWLGAAVRNEWLGVEYRKWKLIDISHNNLTHCFIALFASNSKQINKYLIN